MERDVGDGRETGNLFGVALASARVNQWAWHRKHVTTVISVLEVL